jgi:hypothetical protein
MKIHVPMACGTFFVVIFMVLFWGIMAVVFASRMLRLSREPVKISRSTHSSSVEVCVPDDKVLAAVFSTSGEAKTTSLAVSISRVKTLGLTFGGCTWQWRLPSRFLVEGII